MDGSNKSMNWRGGNCADIYNCRTAVRDIKRTRLTNKTVCKNKSNTLISLKASWNTKTGTERQVENNVSTIFLLFILNENWQGPRKWYSWSLDLFREKLSLSLIWHVNRKSLARQFIRRSFGLTVPSPWSYLFPTAMERRRRILLLLCVWRNDCSRWGALSEC